MFCFFLLLPTSIYQLVTFINIPQDRDINLHLVTANLPITRQFTSEIDISLFFNVAPEQYPKIVLVWDVYRTMSPFLKLLSVLDPPCNLYLPRFLGLS